MKQTSFVFRWGLFGAVLWLASPLAAQVRLARVFTDHMVLQRDSPVHVWGWARKGQEVHATFRGESLRTEADASGRWDVFFSRGAAGGPFTLTVRGPNEIVLNDILAGDIWLASGQSNMEMPVAGWGAQAAGGKAAPLRDSAEEIKAANHPRIRLFRVGKRQSEYPLDDIGAATGWEPCTPETVGAFSAAAYFFARDVQAAVDVPIGLIQATWGGTPGVAWTSMQALTTDANLLPLLADHEERIRDRASELRRMEQEKLDEKSGLPPPAERRRRYSAAWQPATLFNGMIAPLTPLRIKGFLWYQGESDWVIRGGRLYGKLLPALIGDWRRAWQQGDIPFLFAQISAFAHIETPTAWPCVREGQRRALSVANTGMAVTADIGDADNVHPANKQDVGKRLSLIARGMVYGQAAGYSGPAYRETTRDGNRLRAWFDHAEGLRARDGKLDGFEVAGSDRVFVPAVAEIGDGYVSVGSAQVPAPVWVRYAWQANPTLTLFNAAGLPASPFTSEESY